MGNSWRRNILPGLVCGVLFCQVAALPQSASAQEDKLQAPPVTGLVPDHATLSVESLEREAEWYERVLGFKVFSKMESDPVSKSWHLVIPGYRIDLIQYKGSKRPTPVDPIYLQQGWTHVVFHVEDVAVALKTLQALDVDAKVNKDNNGTPIQLLLTDPEGNQIEIRRNLVV
jgi:catechol 2,3-dioxygenase-like lactoylglutathione lyase family enzyme